MDGVCLETARTVPASKSALALAEERVLRRRALRRKKGGEKITLGIVRNRAETSLEVQLEETRRRGRDTSSYEFDNWNDNWNEVGREYPEAMRELERELQRSLREGQREWHDAQRDLQRSLRRQQRQWQNDLIWFERGLQPRITL